MNDTIAISKVISKWKLNQSMLAKLVGIPNTTFTNATRGEKYYYFSDDQIKKIKSVLNDMKSDLDNITKKKSNYGRRDLERY